MSETPDPFQGWEMWTVGCHWRRILPDGRRVTLSTWSCGAQSGYSLTLNYETTKFPGLDEALAAYEVLARSAPGTTLDGTAVAHNT
jgi:hypothetical protein